MFKSLKTSWIFRFHRGRSLCYVLGIALVLAGPLLLYTWILSVHRFSNLREILAAVHTMTLPVVQGYPRCRHLNATHFKCLPNVFFIGASKCGTTTLIEYLDQLPGIALANRHITVRDHHREVHRFDRNTYAYAWKFLELAEEWASAPIVSDPSTAVVHYTPHYLYAPTVPYDLRAFYPEDGPHPPKFIVLLRDPVARALSSYWFSQSRLFGDKLDRGSMSEFVALAHGETRSRERFDACIASQQQQQQQPSSELQEPPQIPIAVSACFGEQLRSARLGGRHVDKGVYADQLERWFSAFPPVVRSDTDAATDSHKEHRYEYFISTLEALISDESVVLRHLSDFLFDHSQAAGSEHSASHGNTGSASSRSLPARGFLSRPNALASLEENRPPEELLGHLRAFYRPHMRRLRALLQKHRMLAATDAADAEADADTSPQKGASFASASAAWLETLLHSTDG
jgi:hypothetical protein